MLVLALNRRLHIFLGVCSADFNNLKNDFFASFKCYLYASGLFILIIDSCAYLYFHFMDFATSTNATIVVMACSAGLGCYYSVGSKMKTLKTVYNDFQKIHDKGKRLMVNDKISTFKSNSSQFF